MNVSITRHCIGSHPAQWHDSFLQLKEIWQTIHKCKLSFEKAFKREKGIKGCWVSADRLGIRRQQSDNISITIWFCRLLRFCNFESHKSEGLENLIILSLCDDQQMPWHDDHHSARIIIMTAWWSAWWHDHHHNAMMMYFKCHDDHRIANFESKHLCHRCGFARAHSTIYWSLGAVQCRQFCLVFTSYWNS